jgi:hypothetical protein
LHRAQGARTLFVVTKQSGGTEERVLP